MHGTNLQLGRSSVAASGELHLSDCLFHGILIQTAMMAPVPTARMHDAALEVAGSVWLERCTFDSVDAPAGAVVVHDFGLLTASDSHFISNHGLEDASGYEGVRAGAINVEQMGALDLRNCEFTSNAGLISPIGPPVAVAVFWAGHTPAEFTNEAATRVSTTAQGSQPQPQPQPPLQPGSLQGPEPEAEPGVPPFLPGLPKPGGGLSGSGTTDAQRCAAARCVLSKYHTSTGRPW